MSMNDSECGIRQGFESFRCVLYMGYKDRTPLGARKGSATAQGPKPTATQQEQGPGVATRDSTGSCCSSRDSATNGESAVLPTGNHSGYTWAQCSQYSAHAPHTLFLHTCIKHNHNTFTDFHTSYNFKSF